MNLIQVIMFIVIPNILVTIFICRKTLAVISKQLKSKRSFSYTYFISAFEGPNNNGTMKDSHRTPLLKLIRENKL